jgi:hypothetical protein
MLMVVMGAGASFDSVPEIDWSAAQRLESVETRPPLAKELFAAVNRPRLFGKAARAHPNIRGLIASLQRIAVAGGNIEDALQAHAERLDDPVAIRERLELRYYLRSVVKNSCSEWWGLSSTVTNHDALIHRIDSFRRNTGESVLIVTFNYDDFIERALDAIGVQFKGPDDFMKGPDYYLAKLHGSVNWEQIAELPNWGGSEPETVRRAGELRLTGRLANAGEVRDFPALPAIAVPIRRKQEFECPSDHVARLKRTAEGSGQVPSRRLARTGGHFRRAVSRRDRYPSRMAYRQRHGGRGNDHC